MSLSEWIQVIAIVGSITLGLLSIRLTNKNIELANRPYLSVYIHFVDSVSAAKYLVVKNFGNSAAKITRLDFSDTLDRLNEKTQLQSLVGTTIAPTQKFMTFVDNDFSKQITATLEYTDSRNKKYSEQFYLRFDISEDLNWVSEIPGGKDNETDEAKAIRSAAYAIVKHME